MEGETMQRCVAVMLTTLTTASMLAMTGVAAGAHGPVGACPTGTWELIGTHNNAFLENLDRNGDGFICLQPSRTPEGSPHTGSTVTDNNPPVR
jgi:hypothetical protein